MLTEPLPQTLDIRKAAVRGATVSGVLSPSDLPRLQGLLADDEGRIEAQLALARDEENRCIVSLELDATVNVTCQRCLDSMQTNLHCENNLAAVWNDEQARHLPKHLDPLIVSEEACNLWDVVEEELVLGLPQFHYHETEECKALLAGYAEPEAEEQDGDDRPNPFEVLAQLKPGSSKQE